MGNYHRKNGRCEALTIYTGGLAGAGTLALTEADKKQGLQNA